MADIASNLINFNAITGTLQNFTWLFWIAVIGGGLIFAVVWFKKRQSYNIGITIYDVVSNGQPLESYDKARQFKDKDKVVRWELEKNKHIIPPPPHECINLTSFGKKSAIFLRFNGSEYKPTQLKINTLKDQKVTSIDEATQEERAEIARQYELAARMEGESIWQKLEKFAVPIALVIILLLTFVFWGNITAPTVKVAEQTSQVMDKVNEALTLVQQVCREGQFIRAANITGVTNTPVVP